MLDALIQVKSQAIPGFSVPFCLLHGTNDMACPISGAEYMYATASSEASEFHALDGMYHALFADFESHRPMKLALEWIEKRIAAKRQ